MPSKHELLDFISVNGSVTIKDIELTYNVTHQCVSITFKALRRQGCLRVKGTEVDNRRGRNAKIYELTEKGYQRLKYFDEVTCNNNNCSCKGTD